MLGTCAPSNRAGALLSTDGPRLIAVDATEGGPPGAGRADLALWFGRLKCWLAEVFRGVTRPYLDLYLAEFAARHGRVARRGASQM